MKRGAVIAVLITLMPIATIATIAIDAERAGGAAPKWSISPNPDPPAAEVAAFTSVSCPSTTFCVAVGYRADPAISVVIEHWNGNQWRRVAGRNRGTSSSNLRGVACVGPTNCFAVGDYYYAATRRYKPLIEHWDGKQWSTMSAPTRAGASWTSLTSVSCPLRNSCFAVGSTQIGSTYRTLVEHWDGSHWNIMPSRKPAGAGFVALSDVACVSTSSCFAVGNASVGNFYRTLVERWNGRVWQLMASPNAGNLSGLNGVSCASPTYCIAVGSYQVSNFLRVYSQRWNGTKWQRMTTAKVPGPYSNSLSAVSCPTSTSCFAVGYRSTTGRSKTMVLRRNGSAWHIMGSPNEPGQNQSYLADVACPTPTECFAVGAGNKTLVERYN